MHGAWLWVMLGAFLVFVWAVSSIAKRMRSIREEDAEPVGAPRCVVCDSAPATHRLPVIARSWFESLNPLRSLYGAVHLYRRGEDGYSAPQVCEAHRDLYASFMDEGLARIRSLNSLHAAQVDREVSDLRTGVLLARTKAYVAGAEHSAPVPQLMAPPEVEVEEVAVGRHTTNGKSLNGATAN